MIMELSHLKYHNDNYSFMSGVIAFSRVTESAQKAFLSVLACFEFMGHSCWMSYFWEVNLKCGIM